MKNSPETLKKRNELKRQWKKIIDPKSFPHYIKKICKDCKVEKDCQWQHSFTQTGNPEYRARCVKCHKIYLSKLRKRPETKKKRNTKRKELLKERREYAINYLGGNCIECGYNGLALTFHHRNPEDKEFQISTSRDYNIDKINKELDKCDLMCFNCHMELHWEE